MREKERENIFEPQLNICITRVNLILRVYSYKFWLIRRKMETHVQGACIKKNSKHHSGSQSQTDVTEEAISIRIPNLNNFVSYVTLCYVGLQLGCLLFTKIFFLFFSWTWNTLLTKGCFSVKLATVLALIFSAKTDPYILWHRPIIRKMSTRDRSNTSFL